MLFSYALTIPANTAETDPETAFVQIIPGEIVHVSVSFPPGAAALAHVAVRFQETQIIPANASAYLAWDNLTLNWPEKIGIDQPPFKLKLVGWNEDDTYEHTIVFRFDVHPPTHVRPGLLLKRLFKGQEY